MNLNVLRKHQQKKQYKRTKPTNKYKIKIYDERE